MGARGGGGGGVGTVGASFKVKLLQLELLLALCDVPSEAWLEDIGTSSISRQALSVQQPPTGRCRSTKELYVSSQQYP